MLSPCQELPAVILVLRPGRIEKDLAAGTSSALGATGRCERWLGRDRGTSARWTARLWWSGLAGHGVARVATHVLVPAHCLPRRADSTEVVGMALLARADGHGYRRIVADLNRPVGTVRGWLRPLQARHLTWLHRRGVEHTYRHDQELLNDQKPHADAPDALGRAVMAFRRRFTTSSAVTWSLVTMFTSGRLLGPTPMIN
jgi:hypothetical protein